MMLPLLRRHALSKVNDIDESTLRDLSDLVDQAFELLKGFEGVFGLLIAPPTTEYLISILNDSCHALEGSAQFQSNSFRDSWKSTLKMHVSSMLTVWPAFGKLRDNLQEDLVFDEASSRITGSTSISYSNGSPPIENAGKNVQSINSNKNSFGETPFTPIEPGLSEILANASSMSNFHRQSTNQMNVSMPSASNAKSTIPSFDQPGEAVTYDAGIAGVGTSSTFDIGDSSRNSIPDSVSGLGPNMDADGMFNEFTVLDAMEW
jgi:hypothetical protein